MASLAPPADPTPRARAWRTFARDFFTGLDAPPANARRLRTAALIKLGAVVPFFYVPTAYWFVHAPEVFAPKPGLAWAALVWFVLAVVSVVLNVILALTAPTDRAQPRMRLLTFAIAAAEVGDGVAVQHAMGTVTSYLPIIFVLMIATYRVFLDYALALFATLLAVVVFSTVALLEVFGALAPNPFFLRFENPVANYVPAVLTIVEIIDATLLLTFFTVNYGVNQAVKLHRYITESVLRRYLPASLVDRAARGELRMDAPPERRVVTAMFTDLVGFTTMSEELGPDAVGGIIDRYLSRVADLAHAHGATVDKFIGDCVMIVFGAPDPLEPSEQARRGVELALAIQAMMPSIDRDVQLVARTGMNTGEAVVGNFGCASRSDYTVIGPAVNVAARLEGAGQPGRILIGEETARLLDGGYELEPVGELRLKNVSRPVRAFFVGRALRAST
jgi:class 3 adenylate cyclase